MGHHLIAPEHGPGHWPARFTAVPTAVLLLLTLALLAPANAAPAEPEAESATPPASAPPRPEAEPPAPAPAPPPVLSEEDLERVAALRKEAEREFRALAKATRAYEKAAEEVERAQYAAYQRQLEVARAESSFQVAQGELETYVRAVYRSPLPRGVLMLAVQTADDLDALRTVTDLQKMSDSQNGVVDKAHRLRLAAEELASDAENELTEASNKAKRLSKIRDELVETSEAIVLRLTTEVERIGGGGGMRASSGQLWSCDGSELVEDGGWPNGLIPTQALCPLPQENHFLRGDAASQFILLNRAFRAEFGRDTCIISSYRDLATQQRLYATRPHLAAIPGRSNHGWGLAIDFCQEEGRFFTEQHNWLKANSTRWGWVHPSWAAINGARPEAWHWEFALG